MRKMLERMAIRHGGLSPRSMSAFWRSWAPLVECHVAESIGPSPNRGDGTSWHGTSWHDPGTAHRQRLLDTGDTKFGRNLAGSATTVKAIVRLSWSLHGAGWRRGERWSVAVHCDDMKLQAVSGGHIHHVRGLLRGLLAAEPPRDRRVALQPEGRAGWSPLS